MWRISRLWSEFRSLVRDRRVQLALSIRATIAALTSFAIAQFLHLPLPLWAVLTSVIVTQMSVGRSLKATFDYLVGTLGGAIYGGLIGALVPHASEFALLAILALAVAPLSFIASINPRFSVAPITAVIVLLVPTFTNASPIGSALDRVIEVAIGGVTGLVVSFLLLPSRAHPLLVKAAARTLDQMAGALGELFAGLTRGLDADSLHRVQDGVGQAVTQMNGIGAEAERERSAGLAAGPSAEPLLRTVLRLRHDLVMIGRAAVEPAARGHPDAARTEPRAGGLRLFRVFARERGRAARRGGARRRSMRWSRLLDAYAGESRCAASRRRHPQPFRR